MSKKHKKNANTSHFNANYVGQMMATVDLHGKTSFEEVVLVVDRFLVSQRIININYLKKYKKIKLGIIVGKGNHSKRRINGKNPLWHWAEMYLKATDHIFGGETEQTGIITLELE